MNITDAAYIPPAGTETPCYNPQDDPAGIRMWADDWFLPRQESVQAARRCRPCPVKVECAAHAMRIEAGKPAGDRFGVWGGLRPIDRARLADAGSA